MQQVADGGAPARGRPVMAEERRTDEDGCLDPDRIERCGRLSGPSDLRSGGPDQVGFGWWIWPSGGRGLGACGLRGERRRLRDWRELVCLGFRLARNGIGEASIYSRWMIRGSMRVIWTLRL